MSFRKQEVTPLPRKPHTRLAKFMYKVQILMNIRIILYFVSSWFDFFLFAATYLNG